MDAAVWREYIASVLKLDDRQFSVDVLTGGFLNSTIRLRLEEPVPLSTYIPVPTSEGFTSRSFVLKHGPPHMASDPSHALSTFRQTREARALELLGDPTLEKAWKDLNVKAPKLVWHDEAKMVLWMTDLGSMLSLTDFLRSADLDKAGLGERQQNAEPSIDLTGEETRAGDISERVGRAFAQLHLHTLNPAPNIVARFKDPLDGSHAESDIEKHQATQLLNLMKRYGGHEKYPDAADLCRRLGLGKDATGPPAEQVLSMGDIWPGSILLKHDGSDGDTPSASSVPDTLAAPAIGLIDWEFFGASHPGSQLGTLAGHLSVHSLELAYPPSPIPTANSEIRSARIEALGPALVDSYLQTVRGKIGCTPAWQRSVLCSWGREVGNAPGFWADLLSEDGKRRCVEMSAEALRAAGPDESSIDLNREGLPGGLLRRLLDWGA